MSSRAVVTVVCDWCAQLSRPETFATRTMVVKFGSDPGRQVDLCDEHAGPAEALRAVVRSRGAHPQPIPRGQVRCEICGQPYKVGAGLAAHTRARHGV